MVETPKLDGLAKFLERRFLPYLDVPTAEERLTYIENALLEIREILKTVRQKALP